MAPPTKAKIDQVKAFVGLDEAKVSILLEMYKNNA